MEAFSACNLTVRAIYELKVGYQKHFGELPIHLLINEIYKLTMCRGRSDLIFLLCVLNVPLRIWMLGMGSRPVCLIYTPSGT